MSHPSQPGNAISHFAIHTEYQCDFPAVRSGHVLLRMSHGAFCARRLLHGHATTHLTGLTTKTAMSLAAAQLGAAAEMSAQFSCFIAGAFATALALGGNDKFEHTPRYALLLGAIGAVVLGAAACDSDTAAVMLVTFAAGLQNAMATFYSGAVVRTTHVTGTATDIGIEAAKLLLKGRKAHPTWKLRLLCVFLLGFFAGGCAGAVCAALIPAWSLVVPGVSTLALAVAYLGFLLHGEIEKAAAERGEEREDAHNGGEKPAKSFEGCAVAIDVVLESGNREEETKQG